MSADLSTLSLRDLDERIFVIFNQFTTIPTEGSKIFDWTLKRLELETHTLDSLTPDIVNDAYRRSMDALNSLIDCVLAFEEISEGGGTRETRTMLERLRHTKEMVGQSYAIISATMHISIRSSNPSGSISEDGRELREIRGLPWLISGYDPAATRKLPPFHMLSLFLLNYAMMHKYRRDDTFVYEQIFTPGHGPSHAWRQLFTIEEFVFVAISKEDYNEEFTLMMSNPHLPNQLANFLVKCNDREFPRLERNRRYMSFQNGLYDLHEDSFMPWGDVRLSDDMVACKYHDMHMPRELFDAHYTRNVTKIPTPALDTVWTAQGIESGSTTYIFCLAWAMGRCLHPMGLFESNHRSGVFILGVAGSGKSTIANTVMRFYEPGDTETVNNHCEEMYALDGMNSKFVWFCTEVKSDFRLNTALLQLMLEAGQLKIQGKFKRAKQVQWRVPGLMCGNELPQRWVDVANALGRRILIIEFPNAPEHMDPTLDEKIMQELPYIIVKVNRMYRYLVALLNGKSIDTKLPEYFLKTLKKFQRRTQPMLSMLHENEDLEWGPHKKMSMLELKTMFNEYCRMNNLRPPPLNDDEINRILKSARLEVREIKPSNPIPYCGAMRAGTFIIGAGKRDQAPAFASGAASSVAGGGAAAAAAAADDDDDSFAE